MSLLSLLLSLLLLLDGAKDEDEVEDECKCEDEDKLGNEPKKRSMILLIPSPPLRV